MKNHYDIIKAPVITEKSTAASAAGKVVFWVDVAATKKDIKEAVEKVFNVKVLGVNTERVAELNEATAAREGVPVETVKARVRPPHSYNAPATTGPIRVSTVGGLDQSAGDFTVLVPNILLSIRVTNGAAVTGGRVTMASSMSPCATARCVRRSARDACRGASPSPSSSGR